MKLLAGTTSWLMLDITTRRPLCDISSLRDKMLYAREKHAISEPAQKLPFLKGRTIISSIRAGYVDLDMNGHVNNTIY